MARGLRGVGRLSAGAGSSVSGCGGRLLRRDRWIAAQAAACGSTRRAWPSAATAQAATCGRGGRHRRPRRGRPAAGLPIADLPGHRPASRSRHRTPRTGRAICSRRIQSPTTAPITWSARGLAGLARVSIAARRPSRLPPALVLTAGFDPLRDEGAAYADRLSAAGNRVAYVCFERQIHGFILMGKVLDEANAAVGLCASELKRALA